jgi:hypothetical protein
MKMPFRVEVRRDPEDSRFWLADVVGLEGGHTSSRSLATLRKYVHEVIILALDLPDEAEEDLELEWQYHTGDDDVDIATERLRRLRAELDAAQRRLAEHTSDLAHRLVTDSRFSVREAAALLAISPARVDQLVQGARQKGRDQQAA